MSKTGFYLAGLAAMAMAAPAFGQTSTTQQGYAIEAQDLGTALRAFAAASGREVIADAALVAGKRSAPLAGRLDAEAALAQLLRGTRLTAQGIDGAFVIRAGASGQAEGNGSEIVVVGTRIRGAAPVGSPVTIIDRNDLERSGRGTIQSFLETIPSNFGGGQNESTLGSSSRNNSGENQGFGSSINLRGLGSSATLVLFDGNRPALGGTSGTFADVSLTRSAGSSN